MKYGIVVPVYKHGSTLEGVVKNLDGYGLPIIVVDDGNGPEDRAFIDSVCKKYKSVHLVTHKKNMGKGRAVRSAFIEADRLGLTHIMQIDSDGQHDACRIAHFLEKSMQNPDCVICGYPEYDESAPKKRVNGRKVANAWIHIVTLSRSIKDALIGFRIYPVAPYMRLVRRHTFIDSRMGFDPEVLVHFYWLGVPIISESVKVSYPKDGVSNFHIVRDNIRISGMYARLCMGMIFRFPKLVCMNIRRGRGGSNVGR